MFIAFKLACVARNFVINLRKLIYNLLSRLVILYVKVTYDIMINNLLDVFMINWQFARSIYFHTLCIVYYLTR